MFKEIMIGFMVPLILLRCVLHFYQAFLYKELRTVRDKIAEDLECPKQMIADDGACFLMSLYPPNDLAGLAKGELKVKANQLTFV